MQCKNHPATAAVARCAGCQESFCSNCLVEIRGTKYCGSCKVMAIEGKAAPNIAPPKQGTCELANQALTYAIIGIFCFGIILGPIAISKASKAKHMIAEDPTLAGEGKATAAMIIGIACVVLWIVGIIIRIAGLAS